MKIDKEINHPCHPTHKLKLEYTEIPFRCDGCREAGIGLKYKCCQQQCEFDLHKICAAAAASSTITHPFYNKCEFEFYHKPPGPETRICDACTNDVLGFVYHCNRCGVDLHPCCAHLPQVLQLAVQEDSSNGAGEHEQRNCLYLSHKLSSSCHQCGNKGLGWSYRSECKTFSLHVSCVKELLVESWTLMYLTKDIKHKHNSTARLNSPSTPSRLKLQPMTMLVRNNHLNLGAGGSTGRSLPVGGKVRKGWHMAGAALRVVLSAVLGDPTAVIAAVIAGFNSK